jgi:DNA-binding transcriptional LysR family regulator
MDVRQLEMFRAVAEEGSFTRAAERLHVSQSAVSRQVQLLEDELGGRLLQRSPAA